MWNASEGGGSAAPGGSAASGGYPAWRQQPPRRGGEGRPAAATAAAREQQQQQQQTSMHLPQHHFGGSPGFAPSPPSASSLSRQQKHQHQHQPGAYPGGQGQHQHQQPEMGMGGGGASSDRGPYYYAQGPQPSAAPQQQQQQYSMPSQYGGGAGPQGEMPPPSQHPQHPHFQQQYPPAPPGQGSSPNAFYRPYGGAGVGEGPGGAEGGGAPGPPGGPQHMHHLPQGPGGPSGGGQNPRLHGEGMMSPQRGGVPSYQPSSPPYGHAQPQPSPPYGHAPPVPEHGPGFPPPPHHFGVAPQYLVAPYPSSATPFGRNDAGCTCKKSQCLKLYCQCFAASALCNSRKCKCANCRNTSLHVQDINDARGVVMERNPSAFEDKFRPILPPGVGVGGMQGPPPPPFHPAAYLSSVPPGSVPHSALAMGMSPPQQHAPRRPHDGGSADDGGSIKHARSMSSDFRSVPAHPAALPPVPQRPSMGRGHHPGSQQHPGMPPPPHHHHHHLYGHHAPPAPTMHHHLPPPILRTHKVGCKCRKSHCLKKYCECFSVGTKCGTSCRCVNCRNRAEPTEEPRSGPQGPTVPVISVATPRAPPQRQHQHPIDPRHAYRGPPEPLPPQEVYPVHQGIPPPPRAHPHGYVPQHTHGPGMAAPASASSRGSATSSVGTRSASASATASVSSPPHHQYASPPSVATAVSHRSVRPGGPPAPHHNSQLCLPVPPASAVAEYNAACRSAAPGHSSDGGAGVSIGGGGSISSAGGISISSSALASFAKQSSLPESPDKSTASSKKGGVSRASANGAGQAQTIGGEGSANSNAKPEHRKGGAGLDPKSPGSSAAIMAAMAMTELGTSSSRVASPTGMVASAVGPDGKGATEKKGDKSQGPSGRSVAGMTGENVGSDNISMNEVSLAQASSGSSLSADHLHRMVSQSPSMRGENRNPSAADGSVTVSSATESLTVVSKRKSSEIRQLVDKVRERITKKVRMNVETSEADVEEDVSVIKAMEPSGNVNLALVSSGSASPSLSSIRMSGSNDTMSTVALSSLASSRQMRNPSPVAMMSDPASRASHGPLVSGQGHHHQPTAYRPHPQAPPPGAFRHPQAFFQQSPSRHEHYGGHPSYHYEGYPTSHHGFASPGQSLSGSPPKIGLPSPRRQEYGQLHPPHGTADTDGHSSLEYDRGGSVSSASVVCKTVLPKSLSYRKICSHCGKTRSEHGELGFGNKCVYQECGRCGAGIQMHSRAGVPMGFQCTLTKEEGASPPAIEAYEKTIQELAKRNEMKQKAEKKLPPQPLTQS